MVLVALCVERARVEAALGGDVPSFRVDHKRGPLRNDQLDQSFGGVRFPGFQTRVSRNGFSTGA